jgi:long-chain acyl-CoA synthetase
LPPDLEEFWRRMGFAVIQGYGLTETAPIVTLNHPFRKRTEGSVGKPLAGVEVRIADDGEILVRGENVTSGYYVAAADPGTATDEPSTTNTDLFDTGGWLHTGDIGERDGEGQLFIKGRKKEMIVTADGLNVFPEDVERVLNQLPGVRDSAIVGIASEGEERVHAVLVLESGIDRDVIVDEANGLVQNHQRIRSASTWPGEALPRTDGTTKLKRTTIQQWVSAGEQRFETDGASTMDTLIARFAGHREVTETTTLDDLGLSSLERVELMVALEDKFQTRIDEARFADVRSIHQLKQLVEQGPSTDNAEPVVAFPTWTRAWPVRVVRRLSLATWILPLTRVFAHSRIEGLEHLAKITGPVIFASNHQSHLDVPVILAALPGRWRARMAPAMLKEFFTAHFHPETHTRRQWLTNSLNYYLACLYFNAFPIPQREAGARHTLHYMGDLTSDGWSILIFPEGVRAATGEIQPFRGGVGMIASRLEVPVVPVRLDGLDRVLHSTWRMARPGRVRVAFGAPLQLRGENYAALALQVEEQVRQL